MPAKKLQVKSRKPAQPKVSPEVKELDAIKRLLILQLITSGIQSVDIAQALGVSKSVVTGLVPARKVKRPTDKS